MNNERHRHDYILEDKKIQKNEKRTLLVILLTFVTMVVEIIYGHLTGSMALLADGWHMLSHVGALSVSYLVYRLARSTKVSHLFTFGTGKLIPLGGYTSAIMLFIVSIIMIFESVMRFIYPTEIDFSAAIGVSALGLIVNIISAFLLAHDDEEDHHNHHHDHVHAHDHNHESIFAHVLADAMTSIFAIAALLLGKYYGFTFADPLMGIVGSLVIMRWAYKLVLDTGFELLDGKSKQISEEKVRKLLEKIPHVKILDLHIWRIAPTAHACEIVIENIELKGASFYKKIIGESFEIEHLVIEESYYTV